MLMHEPYRLMHSFSVAEPVSGDSPQYAHHHLVDLPAPDDGRGALPSGSKKVASIIRTSTSMGCRLDPHADPAAYRAALFPGISVRLFLPG